MKEEMKRTIVLIAVLSIFLSGSVYTQGSGRSDMDRESRNKATVRRYLKELVNNTSGDYCKAYEIISPEFTLCFGGKALDKKGVDAFKATDGLSKPLSKLVLVDDEMIAEGNTVAVRWHDEAIHDKGRFLGYDVVPNDTELTWQGMSFYKFNDAGLMVAGYIVDDSVEVLEMRKRASGPAGSEERNKALVQRYFHELIDRRDYAKAHEIISPDFTITENGREHAMKGIRFFTSREENPGRLSNMGFADDEIIVKGNTVTVRWHATANWHMEETGNSEASIRPVK